MIARTLKNTLRDVEEKLSSTRASLATALLERDLVESVRLKRELDLLRQLRDTADDALIAVSMSDVAA